MEQNDLRHYVDGQNMAIKEVPASWVFAFFMINEFKRRTLQFRDWLQSYRIFIVKACPPFG